jgi:LPXTG-site transpeptidase (sortase) family protein
MGKLSRSLLGVLALLLGLSILPPAPAQAETRAGIPLYFAETGHTLAYNFRQFYDRHGGLPIFGYPVTEVYIEDGRPVQYFERARFEWHATLALVQLGHLGRWAAQERMHLSAFQPLAQPPQEGMFFYETGHSLRGAFLAYWQQNGALDAFGYPLSEEFEEVNAQDGRAYVVQYFERARFELHVGPTGRPLVQLGHLGRQYLAAHPAPAWATQPVSSASQAWSAVRPTHIRVPRIGVNVGIDMTGFSYGQWDVPRYTAAHYWPIAAVPSTTGNIVIAGHVGYSGIIFSQLPNIAVGDEIFVTASGADRRYVVQEVMTLLPSETWAMNPTATETLTLITCIPVNVYSHRLIVRALPVP